MTDVRDRMAERLLADAGIAVGMRVLDVGCGRGDVSLMIARLVGEQGRVLGIDRDARPLAAAQERAGELDLSNVAFAEGDLCALSPEHGSFDAVVGRRVLMYQPDPAHAVRQFARALRPGGLVVFQEHDATMTPGRLTPLPLHERVHEWVWRTVEREGADIHMGFHLPSVLAQVGLAVEQVRAEAMSRLPERTTPPAPLSAPCSLGSCSTASPPRKRWTLTRWTSGSSRSVKRRTRPMWATWSSVRGHGSLFDIDNSYPSLSGKGRRSRRG